MANLKLDNLTAIVDYNKIQSSLGWKPKIKFDDGLKNTIDWYLSNPQWWKDLSENIFEHTPWKKKIYFIK